jgi:N-acetylglucosamine kinase-like BadF-type ATPase
MRYFAGIDAGQSSTRALVADERGSILAQASAGPADEIGASAASTRLRDALGEALARAAQSAALPANTRFEAIVAGISGYEGTVHSAAPELPTDRLVLVHDSRIAHYGAFGGRHGIITIAGTGSVVHGVNRSGESATIGGWGYVFGDQGSAFGIARDAFYAATRFEDRGHSRARLFRRARSHFAATSMHTIASAFYTGRITRAQLATFAPIVVTEAEAGDETAADIVIKGAFALAEQVRACAKQLHMRKADVSVVGGMMLNPYYARTLEIALADTVPSLSYRHARHEPVVGAMILALREAGVQDSPLFENPEMRRRAQ